MEIEVARHAKQGNRVASDMRRVLRGLRVRSALVPPAVQFMLTVLVGVLTGMLSGMFGLGGAVISTPGIRLLGATALQAVGSTLPSILPSSVSGSVRYEREHLINGRIVLLTSAFGVPASIAGSELSGVVPGDGHLLMLATAALVGFTAYRTAFPKIRATGTDGIALHDEVSRLALIGAAAGMLSGLLGVGGGVIMVPLFSLSVGLSLKSTIATSLACVGIFAIPGTLTHWYLGHIDWSFAVALACGVIPGAWIGARFTIASSEKLLRRTVGAALGIIATIYAIGELVAWFK
jgi:uncharacterized membrane protein YfcA